MSRLLLIWIEGALDYSGKWSKNQMNGINILLKSFNIHKPKEIHRSIRSLQDIKFWKGTEFRAFLLYYGIVILKEHLTAEEYRLFTMLIVAVRICYSNAYKSFLGIAKNYFKQYIEGFINIYGIHSISSNIHNLCHVVDDVQRFGCLSDISTYPFENRLQFIKSKLKQRNLPLQQITRRIVELSLDYDVLFMDNEKKLNYPQLKNAYKFENNLVYGEVVISSEWALSTKRCADSWFWTSANDIALMKYAVLSNDEIIIHGCPLVKKENFFTQPVSSMRMQIFQSDGCIGPLSSFKLENIKAKMIRLPVRSDFVFMPLLHTIS